MLPAFDKAQQHRSRARAANSAVLVKRDKALTRFQNTALDYLLYMLDYLVRRADN